MEFTPSRPAWAALLVATLLLTSPAPVYCSSMPGSGPHPWDLKPKIGDGVNNTPIPVISTTCKRTMAPVVKSLAISRSYYHYGNAQIDYTVDWCPGANQLRVRVLSFQKVVINGKTTHRTTVLSSTNQDYLQYSMTALLSTKCKPMNVFIEVCGKLPGKSRPLCGTSQIKPVFAYTVIPPVLVSRAPFNLKLAPGDKPLIKYSIKPGATSFGFGPSKYRLQIAAVARNGRWLGASRWVSDTEVSVRLPLSGKKWRGVRPWEYDGAEVFLRFAYQSCPSNVGTMRMHEKTTISVKRGSPQLVRQDRRIPTVEKLVYPATVAGQPVALAIAARNEGGGRRKGWRPTPLMYQWYMRDFDFGFSPSYPKVLEGETGPTLRLSKAECEVRSCGRHGCSDLKQYSVVVCNTLGCVRSNVVGPNIVAPGLKAGERWDEYMCKVLKK